MVEWRVHARNEQPQPQAPATFAQHVVRRTGQAIYEVTLQGVGLGVVNYGVFRLCLKMGMIAAGSTTLGAAVACATVHAALSESAVLFLEVGRSLLGDRQTCFDLAANGDASIRNRLRRHTWVVLDKLGNVAHRVDVIYSHLFGIRTLRELKTRAIPARDRRFMEMVRNVAFRGLCLPAADFLAMDMSRVWVGRWNFDVSGLAAPFVEKFNTGFLVLGSFMQALNTEIANRWADQLGHNETITYGWIRERLRLSPNLLQQYQKYCGWNRSLEPTSAEQRNEMLLSKAVLCQVVNEFIQREGEILPTLSDSLRALIEERRRVSMRVSLETTLPGNREMITEDMVRENQWLLGCLDVYRKRIAFQASMQAAVRRQVGVARATPIRDGLRNRLKPALVFMLHCQILRQREQGRNAIRIIPESIVTKYASIAQHATAAFYDNVCHDSLEESANRSNVASIYLEYWKTLEEIVDTPELTEFKEQIERMDPDLLTAN